MFHSQLSADCGTGIKISAQWLICLGLAAQESLHAAKINFSYSGPQNSDSKCYPTSATPSTDHWDPGLNSDSTKPFAPSATGLTQTFCSFAHVTTTQRARMDWCQRHHRWTNQQWASVMFSDESRFVLDFHDRRIRVWRRRGERYQPPATVAHNRYGGGSVMVWAGICMNDRTDLHICQDNITGLYYRDNIIEPIVVPFAQRHGPDFIFQDDNARPHRARVVQDHLQMQHIRTLPWPAMSPDLSPIEHLWDLLTRRVQQRPAAPQTLQQLAQALQQEWQRIPQDNIRRLICSMKRRCNACLAANGGPTRF